MSGYSSKIDDNAMTVILNSLHHSSMYLILLDEVAILGLM